ncbi:MAG: hypothetical protein HZB46_14610 [Solirubrobacterales bacterium]|nr:hypothetical protein [Solirubrobacterales bacterium]
MTPLTVLAALALVALAVVLGVRRLLAGSRTIEGVEIRTPTDDTRIDADGVVRSIQSADMVLPEDLFEELWTPSTLERLARTYWSFLSACTLGLVRVYYTETERYACLLFRPFKLLTFDAPEYETNADRGIVRWRIKKGLLVAPSGREGDGYLEIDVRRLACDIPGKARINVEVEVANFYPAIAHSLSKFVYTNTQSRIHVIVTHGFLRRVAHRELDESVTGRFRDAQPDRTPEPRRERDEARAGSR